MPSTSLTLQTLPLVFYPILKSPMRVATAENETINLPQVAQAPQGHVMAVVGEKDPGRQVKRGQCPVSRRVEGSCQQSEIRLGEFLSPPEPAHGD
jgi:hypothetical protein